MVVRDRNKDEDTSLLKGELIEADIIIIIIDIINSNFSS